MGHKVLLADDSITVQKIVKLSLTEEGIEISQAIGSKLSLMSNQGTQLAVRLDRAEFARAL